MKLNILVGVCIGPVTHAHRQKTVTLHGGFLGLGFCVALPTSTGLPVPPGQGRGGSAAPPPPPGPRWANTPGQAGERGDGTQCPSRHNPASQTPARGRSGTARRLPPAAASAARTFPTHKMAGEERGRRGATARPSPGGGTSPPAPGTTAYAERRRAPGSGQQAVGRGAAAGHWGEGKAREGRWPPVHPPRTHDLQEDDGSRVGPQDLQAGGQSDLGGWEVGSGIGRRRHGRGSPGQHVAVAAAAAAAERGGDSRAAARWAREEEAKKGAGAGEPVRTAPAASLLPAPGLGPPCSLASPRPGLGGCPWGAGDRTCPASPRPAGPPGRPGRRPRRWGRAGAVSPGRALCSVVVGAGGRCAPARASQLPRGAVPCPVGGFRLPREPCECSRWSAELLIHKSWVRSSRLKALFPNVSLQKVVIYLLVTDISGFKSMRLHLYFFMKTPIRLPIQNTEKRFMCTCFSFSLTQPCATTWK